MTELIDFSEYRRRGGGKQRTYFDQGELRQLLAMYSVRVSTGEWRDYGMSFLRDVAIFSDPARPLEPFPPPNLGTCTQSRTPARLFPSFTSSYLYGKCINPLGHAYLAQ